VRGSERGVAGHELGEGGAAGGRGAEEDD
jgi:hypothetical protein